ncbi:MAG: hypothetical protein LBC97_07650 [Bifidobacteriaceae bacterium]|jgi:hypothetical protein|nr:hypothetical protein [Bifidobacteriaceae bacterium]
MGDLGISLAQPILWANLGFGCLVFGFAPGVALRVILVAFPKTHPRRTELLAELRAVPYWKRPLWVSEQMEVALCEGLPARWSKWRQEVPHFQQWLRHRLLAAGRAALDAVIVTPALAAVLAMILLSGLTTGIVAGLHSWRPDTTFGAIRTSLLLQARAYHHFGLIDRSTLDGIRGLDLVVLSWRAGWRSLSFRSFGWYVRRL